LRLIKGSGIPDDPFKHDVVFIEDTLGEYLRIDFLLARDRKLAQLLAPSEEGPEEGPSEELI